MRSPAKYNTASDDIDVDVDDVDDEDNEFMEDDASRDAVDWA